MEVDPDPVVPSSEITTHSTPDQNQCDLNLRDRILSHLASCDDIHFKSQQIGDPELSSDEKKCILVSVLDRSHGTFLSRFGHRLLPEHLEYFDEPADQKSYEVEFYLNKLKRTKCKPVSHVSTLYCQIFSIFSSLCNAYM